MPAWNENTSAPVAPATENTTSCDRPPAELTPLASVAAPGGVSLD